MKVINKIVTAQLKKNIKRSIVTVLGIAVSVAMLTSVVACFKAAFGFAKDFTTQTNGSYNAYFYNVPASQIAHLTDVKDLDKYCLLGEETIMVINSFDQAGQEKHSQVVDLNFYSKNAFNMMSDKLSAGTWPQNELEIVLPENFKKYKIGDQISVTYEKSGYAISPGAHTNYVEYKFGENKQTKIFKITGFLDSSSSGTGKSITYLDESTLESNNNVTVCLLFNDFSWEKYKELSALSPESIHQHLMFNLGSGIVSPDFIIDVLKNDETYMRYSTKIVLGFAILLVAIITIASVVMIYNAFTISLSERSKYLGILSSVGATKSQKFKSVFFEAFVLGGFGIALGILVGFAGIGTTFYLIRPLFVEMLNLSIYLKLSVSLQMICTIIVLAVFSILISALIPAIKSAKQSIINSIKQADIKLTKKQVKTSKLTRKLFGIEGELGLKNLKRNKSKYRVTLLSLVTSIVVFISASALVKFVSQRISINNVATADINVHLNINSLDNFYINANNDDFASNLAATKKELLNKNSKLTLISEHSTYMLAYSQDISENKAAFAKQFSGIYYEDNSLPNERSRICDISVYDEKHFKDVLADIDQNLKIDDFVNQKQPVFLLDGVKTTDNFKLPGAKIIYTNQSNSYDHDYFYCTTESFNKFLQQNTDIKPMLTSYSLDLNIGQADDKKVEKEINEIFGTLNAKQENGEAIYIHINNNKAELVATKNLGIIMAVFIFGFLALISLICVANIFNTISTNVILRRREFAVLKSLGVDEKGIKKIFYYETIFYGIKALIYSLPISLLIILIIPLNYTLQNHSLNDIFNLSLKDIMQALYKYICIPIKEFTPWGSVLIVVFMVFIVIWVPMIYARKEIEKEDVIEAITKENI
ncbi:MAG: FtsX-like permease family protein [Oscillospiraceae bacterium]|nr:FtsX-like permease family protein [Oscillospiraceae bacterium]